MEREKEEREREREKRKRGTPQVHQCILTVMSFFLAMMGGRLAEGVQCTRNVDRDQIR